MNFAISVQPFSTVAGAVFFFAIENRNYATGCFFLSAQRLFIPSVIFLRCAAVRVRLRPSRLPDTVNRLFPFPLNAAMARSRRSRWAVSSAMIEALSKWIISLKVLSVSF